jgi:hypothetical protein
VRWSSGTNTWTTLSASSWLRSVWGSSATDVYAVGGTVQHAMANTGKILHWNGSTVTSVLSRPNDMFHAVWGSSASDVFAATYGGAIVHFNGATWTEQRAGGLLREPLISLWGTGPGDVYAAGVSLQTGDRLLHYDGTSWAAQDPGLPIELQHLAGWGPSDFYVTTKDPGLVLHSDGAQWDPVRLLGADTPILRGAWAVPMPASAPGAPRTRRMMFAGYSYGADDRVYRLERSCEAREMTCSDRGDDDCDGLVDCLDSDCMGDASCVDGGLCRSAQSAACEASIDGDSRSGAWRIDNYRSGPRPETGPETAYRFTAAATGTVTVSLSGFTRDLDVLVVPAAATGGCAPTSGVVAVASTTNASESLTFAATAGTTYYIVVDGYEGAYSAFHLDVTCM